MNYFKEVEKELFKFKNLGEEISQNGTLLIGKALHIAPLAWLHAIYRTLNDEDIIQIETELNTVLPSTFKFFLQNYSNGLGIFVSKFYLYGLRKQLGRSIEASRQPFSLDIPNVDERPANAKPNHFFIGGYKWDGSKLYIDKNTNKVHYCDRWDVTSLYQWKSFEEMIVSEVKRICNLFDENGIIKDPDLYTTPVKREMK